MRCPAWPLFLMFGGGGPVCVCVWYTCGERSWSKACHLSHTHTSREIYAGLMLTDTIYLWFIYHKWRWSIMLVWIKKKLHLSFGSRQWYHLIKNGSLLIKVFSVTRFGSLNSMCCTIHPTHKKRVCAALINLDISLLDLRWWPSIQVHCRRSCWWWAIWHGLPFFFSWTTCVCAPFLL